MSNIPGRKARGIIRRDERFLAPNTRADELPLVYDHADGRHIWDVDGNRFLDFASGVAVMNVGYNHPKVKEALIEQLNKGTHCGFADFYAEKPVEFAEEIVKLAGKPLDTVFFCNSGAEAIETAMKAAMRHTKRQSIISMYGGFHGRTLGALSATCSKVLVKKNYPQLKAHKSFFAYCYRCPLNLKYPDCGIACAKHLENHILKKEVAKEDVAAIIVEPVQGEGGYVVPPKEYHRELRRICDDNDILYIADEVQSGAFRTGAFLASQRMEVKPDLVAMAKGIGGGLPVGAVVGKKKIFDWEPGAHSNTFGGNLLGAAAGLAVLQVGQAEKLADNARTLGAYAIERLQEMQQKHTCIGDVRGLGLMIGVEFVEDHNSKKPWTKLRNKIIAEAFQKGLILLPAGESTIRIAPPLSITKEEMDEGLRIFEQALTQAQRV